MNAQMRTGSGRRWFGAAVAGSIALTLVLLLCTTAPAGALPAGALPAPPLPAPESGVPLRGSAGFIHPDAPTVDLYEPNDTPAAATAFGYDEFRGGLVDPAGDVDYFSFVAAADDTINADMDAGLVGSPLDATLTLYGGDGVTQLAFDDNGDGNSDPRILYTLPVSGTYYLKVQAAGHPSEGDPGYFYWLYLVYGDLYEPNDRLSQATGITIGDEILANIAPANDVDFYRFDATAGQFLTIGAYDESGDRAYCASVTLYGEDGLILYPGTDVWYKVVEFAIRLPANGTYRLRVENYYGDCAVPYLYRLRVEPGFPLLISAPVSGRVHGLAFAPGDILFHQTGTDRWEMYFDASDVGIKANVTGFEGAGFCMSFGSRQAIAGVGIVQPQDVVCFRPESLGPETRGTFYLAFDGSEWGLDTKAEAIDAVAGTGYRSLRMSTKGNFNASGLTGRNNDQLLFYEDPIYYFETWERGSSIPGLASENVTGLDKAGSIWDNRGFFLSVANAFSIGGVSGGPDDIVYIDEWRWDGPEEVSLLWDGRADGFRYALDAIDLPIPPIVP